MDREHVKGAADKAKASIKKTAGKRTDYEEEHRSEISSTRLRAMSTTLWVT